MENLELNVAPAARQRIGDAWHRLGPMSQKIVLWYCCLELDHKTILGRLRDEGPCELASPSSVRARLHRALALLRRAARQQS